MDGFDKFRMVLVGLMKGVASSLVWVLRTWKPGVAPVHDIKFPKIGSREIHSVIVEKHIWMLIIFFKVYIGFMKDSLLIDMS